MVLMRIIGSYWRYGMSLRDEYDAMVDEKREAEAAKQKSPELVEKDLCSRIGRCYGLRRQENWEELVELVKPDRWRCDDLSGHPYEVVKDDKSFGIYRCKAKFEVHVAMPAGGHYLVHPSSSLADDDHWHTYDWFTKSTQNLEYPRDGIDWVLHNQRVHRSNRQRAEQTREQCVQEAEQRVQLVRELSAGCSQEHVGSDSRILFRDGWMKFSWLGGGTYEKQLLEFIRKVNGD